MMWWYLAMAAIIMGIVQFAFDFSVTYKVAREGFYSSRETQCAIGWEFTRGICLVVLFAYVGGHGS